VRASRRGALLRGDIRSEQHCPKCVRTGIGSVKPIQQALVWVVSLDLSVWTLVSSKYEPPRVTTYVGLGQQQVEQQHKGASPLYGDSEASLRYQRSHPVSFSMGRLAESVAVNRCSQCLHVRQPQPWAKMFLSGVSGDFRRFSHGLGRITAQYTIRMYPHT